MQRAKLRKKKVGGSAYWYTEANGGAYFGRVDAVTHRDASRQFREHLLKGREPARTEVLTVGGLLSRFLGWVEANRSGVQYRRRRRDCSRFAKYEFDGRRLADVPAVEVTGAMLEGWRRVLTSPPAEVPVTPADKLRRGLDPQSLLHAEASVRHAFAWGTKYPSPQALLPVTFRPFSGVERTRVPRKALAEADLLLPAEVDALIAAAGYDVDQFRRWGIEQHVKKHGRVGMRPCKDGYDDLLRVYHATGARTGELAAARVRDFSPRSRQIVLGDHKRAKTEKVATVRHIQLNDAALSILRRRCESRSPEEVIFLTPRGKPWTAKTVNRRLHSTQRIAAALGAKFRGEVTIYDLRHLWISEALMAEVDVMTVARMAGTSVRMVETVYGHFRGDHFADAQRKLDESRRKARVGPVDG